MKYKLKQLEIKPRDSNDLYHVPGGISISEIDPFTSDFKMSWANDFV